MNIKKCGTVGAVVFILIASGSLSWAAHEDETLIEGMNAGEYVVVDTGQHTCYDDTDQISCPDVGELFYGQDAQILGVQPVYQDNDDGTITDLNTGLMWQQTPGDKVTYNEAVAGAETFNLAGYDDWRLPSIKELYSLIDFSGIDPSGYDGDISGLTPFIDTDYFDFEYGDTSEGERIIDAQYWSSTEYVGTTMDGAATVFGVNFADGRIKGYPRGTGSGGQPMTEFVRYVRSGPDYGVNDFMDNDDGTITDMATGLTWQQSDSRQGLIWKDALDYAENLEFAGYEDWRLPNAKELQSIVDYTRSPSTSGLPAIDPVFWVTSIVDEAGNTNYPFYWTGTTHANMMEDAPGSYAVYIAFGEALGYMNDAWIDVHGAGAQRSDPKTGDPGDWPEGHGPQGDAIRIYNYVRCVRGGLTDNQAPETPSRPSGPSTGDAGTAYTYTSSATDTDGDQLYYLFDWGDGTDSGWLGPYGPGQEASASHTWSGQGGYEIKVKAKDDDGAQSEWSDSLAISMPKNSIPGPRLPGILVSFLLAMMMVLLGKG